MSKSKQACHLPARSRRSLSLLIASPLLESKIPSIRIHLKEVAERTPLSSNISSERHRAPNASTLIGNIVIR